VYKSKYFKAYELVSKIVYGKFGENSYQFFNKDILIDLDLIRETYSSPIIINNWFWNGKYQESGLRSNCDSIVKNKSCLYLSAHCLGCGFDLKDKINLNQNNKKLYNHIIDLIKNKKLKTFKRLENIKKTPNWVHIDAFQTYNNDLIIF